MKYLLLFLLSVNIVVAQDINKLDDKGIKHGLWKGTYPDSKRPRYEGTFEHGKEIGLFKFFDDTKSGTVIATREFNLKTIHVILFFTTNESIRLAKAN